MLYLSFLASYGQCLLGPQSDAFDFDEASCWGTQFITNTYHVSCPGGNGYVEVLNDEFNGNAVNSSLWRTLMYGNLHALNTATEKEYYKSDNLEVSNGTLKIHAKTETIYNGLLDESKAPSVLIEGIPNERTFYYTSGCLHSLQKFPAGKYEIRCKLPNNDCLWPAFWMRWDGWYDRSQEFDLPDYYRYELNQPFYFRANIGRSDGENQHCGTSREANCNPIDLYSDWHTFTVEWDRFHIVIKLDNQVFRDVYSLYTIAGAAVSECDNSLATADYMRSRFMPIYTNMNVLVNVAVRFNDMSQHGPDPATMEVDYIKGWVKLDCGKDLSICNWNPDRHDSPALADNIEDPTIYTGRVITVAGAPNNCGVSVNAGQFLQTYASDAVIIGDGFDSKLGSSFLAAIKPCANLIPITSKTDDVSHVEPPSSIKFKCCLIILMNRCV